MKQHHLLIILLAFATLIYSCSKDGLTGPEGPAGAEGPAGTAGPMGEAGADGSIIYSGNTAPVLSTGKLGDYYLNRANGQLYGPKTATGWGTPISLHGTDGEDGKDGTNGINGTKTLSGNGAPAAGLGTNGDYYLDKTSYNLYGPKTAAGWGIPILLRGANGAQGPTGAAGQDGSIIYSGFGAPVTSIGKNGDYYLNRNTGQLYGPKNADGWGPGITLRGTNGTNGANGQDGEDGADGRNGTNGSTTLSGNGAPATGIGAIGDYYLDKQNYQLYGPKVAAGWGIPILLRGANGAQGPTGPAGADGTIIYSGDYNPAPQLGKAGDFYFAKVAKVMFGPKTAAGWGTGVNLQGANGANGTNGTTILNGDGPPTPFEETGKDGDFYIDTDAYDIYGPRIGGDWGNPTSLKGADGNANVFSYETTNASTFSWIYSGFDDFTGDNFAYLRMNRNTTFNDTTTLYTIPASASAAAKNGIVLVYVHTPASQNWQQLSFSENTGDNLRHYTYTLNTTGTNAIVRIKVQYQDTGLPFFSVDKVRIVVTPASNTGVLSKAKPSMQQAMQQFHLQDKDFIKLR
jgi:hypothetical protein